MLDEICTKILKEKNLDTQHQKLLQDELKDIKEQNQQKYFLNLYETKTRYAKNENNLIVPYLLGIVDDFDISREPEWIYGDLPDQDIDFIPVIKDYLKDEWAPRQFGEEYVANIASYGSYGIKGSLLDAARVYGKDHAEIQAITKKLGIKDDDGEALTWQAALELYPELNDYCQRNPEVADAVEHLFGRYRSMGKHAGGIIISGRNIKDIVPVVRDKSGKSITAWTEGLHSQDLGPVGMVKFDFLSIINLLQVCLGTHLVKTRHNITNFNALPDSDDWSDTNYLEDKKALKMANDGNLKCVFQFDSEGIRRLAKDAGIDCFEDLVNINALYRPSCLACVSKDTKVGGKSIKYLLPDDKISYVNSQGSVKTTKNYKKHGPITKKVLKITLKSGKTIVASQDHRFLTLNSFQEARFLLPGSKVAVCTEK